VNGRHDEAAEAYTEAVEAAKEFRASWGRLTRRLDRQRQAPDADDYHRRRVRWEAWDRAHARWVQTGKWTPPGLVGVLLPPRPWDELWDELEDEFGPVAEPSRNRELRDEVAKRIAAGYPRDPRGKDSDLTQREVADRFRVSRNKVRGIEQELDPDWESHNHKPAR
jgi:hypothetical protein